MQQQDLGLNPNTLRTRKMEQQHNMAKLFFEIIKVATAGLDMRGFCDQTVSAVSS